jgi:hypothetical protein
LYAIILPFSAALFCVLSAFIINKSKTMESKGYKRFATTEAEIEEKRLKLNAERTIKQNKAAENGGRIIDAVMQCSATKSCCCRFCVCILEQIALTSIFISTMIKNKGMPIAAF